MKKEPSVDLGTIGLTKKENLVYLALLETGPALIAQIARQTNLPRPTIYQI